MLVAGTTDCLLSPSPAKRSSIASGSIIATCLSAMSWVDASSTATVAFREYCSVTAYDWHTLLALQEASWLYVILYGS